ncbi:MAG: type II secretion system protein GspM [Myxococcaceae bacterium]
MKLEALWDRFQALSNEDKKKAVLGAGVLSFLLVVLCVWGAWSSVNTRQLEVRRLATEMKQIDTLSIQYNEVKAEQQAREAQIRSNQVALFTLIQNSATRLDLKLNDLNERKEALSDSNLTQVSVVVTVKELSMDRLTAFLEDIENSSSKGLVKITRLQVKTRFDSPDLLDLQMTVSTWKAS